MTAAGSATSIDYDSRLFELSGDPDAIATSAARWSAFSAAAAGAASDLSGLNTDEFVGDEADEFRDSMDGHLKAHLQTSAEAWGVVGSALFRFGNTLADCQWRLRPLRLRAQDAAAGGDAEYLSSLQARARSIRDDHQAAMTACTADIRRAASMRFAEPPGWFGRLISSVGGWIADHASVLTTISGVLKQISSIAGMLAMIPALAPVMAPIAVTTGAAAVGIDGAVTAATGRGSIGDLLLEGASMLPGARAVAAVGVVQTAQAANRAAHGDGSWMDVAVSAASMAVGRKAARSEPHVSKPRRDTASDVPESPTRAATVTGGASRADDAAGGRPGGSGSQTQYGDGGPTADTGSGDSQDPPDVGSGQATAKEPYESHAGGDADPRVDLPDNLPPGTEYIYRAGMSKVPPEWGPPIPTKKSYKKGKPGSPGLRWFGPNPGADGVRIDVGDPSSPWPSQRVDHVIVRSGGRVLRPDGLPISQKIKIDYDAHIPLSEWITWTEWNKP